MGLGLGLRGRAQVNGRPWSASKTALPSEVKDCTWVRARLTARLRARFRVGVSQWLGSGSGSGSGPSPRPHLPQETPQEMHGFAQPG